MYNLIMESEKGHIELGEVKKPILIREVDPIGDQTHTVFEVDRLNEFIEAPILPACRLLFERGVCTTLSGASRKDIESGHGWATIDYDALSEENKKIAQILVEEKSGSLHTAEDKEGTMFILSIPFEHGPDTTIEEFKTTSLALADRF